MAYEIGVSEKVNIFTRKSSVNFHVNFKTLSFLLYSYQKFKGYWFYEEIFQITQRSNLYMIFSKNRVKEITKSHNLCYLNLTNNIFFAKAENVITVHHCSSEPYSIRIYFILDRLIKFSGQKISILEG